MFQLKQGLSLGGKLPVLIFCVKELDPCPCKLQPAFQSLVPTVWPLLHSVAPACGGGGGGVLRLGLPLPQQVADGGVLCGQRVGEERHEAPEALPQLLHVLLQAVDVRVQLSSAALHLRQYVVHQALHLHGHHRALVMVMVTSVYMVLRKRTAGLDSECKDIERVF